MTKIDNLISAADLNLPVIGEKSSVIDLNKSFDVVSKLPDVPGKYCGVQELSDIFSWKKGFSYLFTGTPGTGKTTMAMYLFLQMSLSHGWKWCVWTPEMEDSYLDKKGVEYHAKDIIYTLIWAVTKKTPYSHYARIHSSAELLSAEETEKWYNWVCDHFKFIHVGDRTPKGIIEGFSRMYDKTPFDGFLIDPWKSVKQVMDMRSDLWLEDALMTLKTFSLETDSVMNFVVHPKSMRDYRDENGNFRVITPFDLNGGPAWNNSMDVIVSLRKLAESTEWYTFKVRKQHLVGRPGEYKDISFDMDTYNFQFGTGAGSVNF